jgi:hypothetical protein
MSKKSNEDSVSAPNIFVLIPKLRPGDVILALGDEKFSEGIAFVTRARFSHAILVVSPGKWFEADDEGVGYTDTWASVAWLKYQGTSSQLRGIPNCRDAQVFRHPALANRKNDEIEAAIKQIVTPWEGEDYSDYRRLYFPLEIAGRPRWWVKLVLAYYQWRDRRRASGMFCLEVIARVFEQLEQMGFQGASLFSVFRRADLVHPGHIVKSRLNLVEGAVINSNCLPQNANIEINNFKWDRRSSTKIARMGRDFDADMERFDQDMKRLEEDLQKVSEQTLDTQAQCDAQIEHYLREAIEISRIWKTPKAEKALNDLLDSLAANAEKIKRHCESRTSNPIDYLDLAEAQAELGFKARETKADMVKEYSSINPDFATPKMRRTLEEQSKAISAGRDRARQIFGKFRHDKNI